MANNEIVTIVAPTSSADAAIGMDNGAEHAIYGAALLSNFGKDVKQVKASVTTLMQSQRFPVSHYMAHNPTEFTSWLALIIVLFWACLLISKARKLPVVIYLANVMTLGAALCVVYTVCHWYVEVFLVCAILVSPVSCALGRYNPILFSIAIIHYATVCAYPDLMVPLVDKTLTRAALKRGTAMHALRTDMETLFTHTPDVTLPCEGSLSVIDEQWGRVVSDPDSFEDVSDLVHQLRALRGRTQPASNAPPTVSFKQIVLYVLNTMWCVCKAVYSFVNWCMNTSLGKLVIASLLISVMTVLMLKVALATAVSVPPFSWIIAVYHSFA